MNDENLSKVLICAGLIHNAYSNRGTARALWLSGGIAKAVDISIDMGVTATEFARICACALACARLLGRQPADENADFMISDVPVPSEKCPVYCYAGKPRITSFGSAPVSDLRRTFLEESFDLLLSALFVEGNANLPLSLIPVVGPKQYDLLVNRFSSVNAAYPREKGLFPCFAEIAHRDPDALAVSGEGHKVTYGQLLENANSVSKLLTAAGVGAGDIVGIFMPQSCAGIAAMLGIVQIGAVYCPIDTRSPDERILKIINSASIRTVAVLEEESGRFRALAKGLNVVVYEFTHEPGEGPLSPFDGNAGQPANQAAYLMFTSGSTGEPKGTLLPCSGIMRLVLNTNYISISPEDRILVASSPAFDASTFELWGGLLNGASLVLAPQGLLLSSDKLGETLAKEKVTILFLTTPIFNLFGYETPEVFRPLRCLCTGGDVIDHRAVNRILEACPGITVVNAYGPTENTTFSTAHVIKEPVTSPVPIGRPVANSETVLLQYGARLAPVGAPGEICLGGDGLAIGYLDEKENARRFIPNPVKPGERLYQTGGLGAWRETGELDFHGRKDKQVKIRGFRVELYEVKLAFLEHPEIHECVVIKHPAEANELVAYCIGLTDANIGEVYDFIRTKLPDYMVPRHAVPVAKFDYSLSGKFDFKALPLPAASDLFQKARNTPAAPLERASGVYEKKIERKFREILKTENVGVSGDFFSLGGDSLKLILFTGWLRKEFDVSLSPLLIYKFPTVRGVAGLVEQEIGARERRHAGKDEQIARFLSGRLGTGLAFEYRAGRRTLKCPRQLDADAIIKIRGEIGAEFGAEMVPDLILSGDAPPATGGRDVKRLVLDFLKGEKKAADKYAQSRILKELPLPRLLQQYLVTGFKECVFAEREIFEWDDARLLGRIDRIVGRNDILRSVISPAAISFRESAGQESPVLDLSAYEIPRQHELTAVLKKAVARIVEARDIGGKPYMVCPVRLSGSRVLLLAGFSHFIADQAAAELFPQQLTDTLPEGAHYSQYLQELNALTGGASIQKLKELDWYRGFRETTLKIYRKFPRSRPIKFSDQVVVDITLDENMSAAAVMLLAFSLFARSAADIRTVTCSFLLNNRNYSRGRYRYTMGDLHDFVPLSLSTGEHSLQYFESALADMTAKKSGYINFTELVLGDEEIKETFETNFSLNLVSAPDQDIIHSMLRNPVEIPFLSYGVNGFVDDCKLTLIFSGGMPDGSAKAIYGKLREIGIRAQVRRRHAEDGKVSYRLVEGLPESAYG